MEDGNVRAGGHIESSKKILDETEKIMKAEIPTNMWITLYKKHDGNFHDNSQMCLKRDHTGLEHFDFMLRVSKYRFDDTGKHPS